MSLTRLDLSRRPFLNGRHFGEVGAFEELTGEAEFAVDPDHALNRCIVDLDLAPRDAAGRVHFTADVRILRPVAGGNRTVFLDVVNRGNSIFSRMLEPGPLGPTTGVTEGFLMRRGFTVVTCGWQHDIPRGGKLFGLSAPPAEVDGVAVPVTGAGFLALRDIAHHMRGNDHQFTIALGASQTGRLLRQLAFLGMCEAEDGTLAVDGVLAVAGGARMTEANQRFGDPSSNGPKSTFFPYRYSELLERATFRGTLPRIIHMDTSSEYCCSSAEIHVSAALGTIADDRQSDAVLPDNVRIYLCSSTQHTPAPVDGQPDGRAVNPPNTIDYKPFVRAAVDNLTAWVRDDAGPPPSAYPRFSDGTLTSDLRPTVDADGNEQPGIRHPDVAVPLATYTGWNPAADHSRTLVRALGSTIAFSDDEITRRYPSRKAFLSKISETTESLARQKYVLAEDVPLMLSTSLRRWDLRCL